MDNPSTTPTYAIPAAIVIAGLLIAGAIFYRSENPNVAVGAVNPKLDTVKGIQTGDHVRGSADAPIAIVDFSDTECPFCKRFHASMIEMMKDYQNGSQVAWVYRHFPLVSLHSKAPKEAEATECAAEVGGEEAFWKYVDRLYEVTPANNGLDLAQLPVIAKEIGLDQAAFESCLASGKYQDRVNADLAAAEAAGGSGTPFPVIVSEKKIKADLSAYMQPGQELIEVSKDGKKVALRGALPTELLKEIVAKIVANK